MRAAFLLLGTWLAACGGRVVLDRGAPPAGTAAGSTGGAGGVGMGSGGGTSSPSGPQGGTGDVPCGGPIYAGKVDDTPSMWGVIPQAEGMISLAAGDNACAVVVAGADHVCDYLEVLAAQARGDLAGIPAGTTAWLQRTTTAIVNGQPSAPGPGGNCNNWTYGGNHLGDGEYLTFDQPGVPTYHLDNDTI